MADEIDGKRKIDGKRRWWPIAIAVLCVAAATAWYSVALMKSTAVNLTPEESEIVNVAKKTLGGQNEWIFDKPRKNVDGSWVVFARSLPPTPGGHCTLRINNQRKVTEIMPGA
jgi:hypothetical protein